MNKNTLALTLLRVVFGLTFLFHGWQKMQMGLGNVGGYFASLGLPSWLAYVVGNLELFGGLLLIIGLLTRYISLSFVIVMIGAIFSAKLGNGFLGADGQPGYEIDIVLLTIGAFFAISGSTGYSADALFKNQGKESIKA
ncbi:putative membrane protein YphA (DoxX/SURF4 family) [Tumebacillus sp. BK434]|uniref:DoxX family protein n=1 Tax=Tumebacillus sp. BK434 TaxID=2512169 RepID=UPI00104F257A|nr:DoxX family protein [Tumebacillus sp. BK434]TCP59205.1 putative membrane protein YphA (DoxX/SURF4 family) [Tumebacillus sp. BK434]